MIDDAIRPGQLRESPAFVYLVVSQVDHRRWSVLVLQSETAESTPEMVVWVNWSMIHDEILC